VGGGFGLGGAVRVLGVLVVLAAVVLGGVVVWRSLADSDGGRRAAAERFAIAWVRGEWAVMWRALTPRARAGYPEARFAAAYRSADRAAGVRSLQIGAIGADRGGGIPVVVTVGTVRFGMLRGTVVLPVSGTGSGAGVDWDPSLRLPGLRRGEAVHTRSGPQPQRAEILAADGTRLDATALGASIAGRQVPSRPAWSASTTAG
jgi:penicillin-binding protein A